MKLLFDQNISYRIVKKSSGAFQNCQHVSSCGLNGAEDTEIWEYTQKIGFAIDTYDSDFYDLGLVKGIPPKIIWIRESNLTTKQLADLLISKYEQISSFINPTHATDAKTFRRHHHLQ